MLHAIVEDQEAPVLHRGPSRGRKRLLNITPLRSTPFAAQALFSPRETTQHDDDETENRVTRQQRLKDRHEGRKSLMSPVDPLASPKATRPKIGLDGAKRSSMTSLTGGSKPSLRSSNISLNTGSSHLPANKLTREQMTKTFDEWMKIAADNKINAKNSWNFALIDYFSELTLLRDGDSINFQKASCTLDGCVKIYTSRVDSVADETGKLLNGLVDHQKMTLTERGECIDDEDGRLRSARRKNPTRHTDTLAKTFESLNVKTYDLEFSVDPLFRKTCKDFDESGARGLLLNHLRMDPSGSLLFDAGDVQLDLTSTYIESPYPSEPDIVLDADSGLIAELAKLDSKDICPSFKHFNLKHGSFELFEGRDFEDDFSETLRGVLERLEKIQVCEYTSSTDGVFMKTSSPFQDGNMICENTDGWMHDGDAFGSGDDGCDSGSEIEEQQSLTHCIQQSMAATSATPMELPFIEDGTAASPTGLTLVAQNENLFSYFDHTLKNWAGPEHWKVPSAAKLEMSNTTFRGTFKTTSSKKESTLFDFLGAPEVDIKTLFAKGSATISVSRESHLQEKTKLKNLLPEDLGIGSKDMLRLFTKANWTLSNLATQKLGLGGMTASAANDRKRDSQNLACLQEVSSDPGLAQDGPVWNGDEYPQDASSGGDDENEAAQMATLSLDIEQPNKTISEGQDIPLVPPRSTIRPTRIKFTPINYARLAKRIDVHALENNLWTSLQSLVGGSHAGKKLAAASVIRMTQVIDQLESSYSKEQLAELSIPFCFVTFLHLANEKGLSLSNSPALDELYISCNAAA